MPLFEDQTPEAIRSRILSRMESGLQTREGSYSYDMASPVSFELWRMLMTLGELVAAFYVDEYSGPWLDRHASLLGMAPRRAGTNASAVVTFTGRTGATVPAGTAFYTASGLEYLLEEDVTLQEGKGTGRLTAAGVGDAYNVDAGEIDRIMSNIVGVESFSTDAAVGGADPESDASLYSRIDFRRRNPSTSGNEHHYVDWALSCDGVGAAKVDRQWDGPGTVRVLLVGYDRRPVDQAVVSACAAYIETQRPVGAEVTVVSATGTPIAVSAQVTVDGGTTLDAVRSAFVSRLDTYLRQMAFDRYIVYINRIGALLSSVEGVVDYSGLTVNGGTDNIIIAETAVPVRGEVALS